MEPGTRLGPYEIQEQLGAGGMGEVYLAQDTRLGRQVAVKVLPPEFASDPERLARFEQEARAAASLNHPHIAAMHDVGSETTDGGATIHFMVQECLQGQTLRDLLDRGAMPLPRVLEVAIEIGEALEAAHRAGIVHRDLKPANLFVTDDGHAKVLDFGLAKLTELGVVASGNHSLSPTVHGTVAGQIMGTAGYMAPEQVEGADDVDSRADLFAFGAVLYEMVGGQRAFDGETVLDSLHAITRTEPDPLGESRADLPADLDRILRKCLVKDRTRRYQTAADIVVDLRQLSDDVAAGRALPAAEAAAAVAGPARGVSAAVAVAMVVVAAVAGYLLAVGMGDSPTAEAPTRRGEVRLADPDGPSLMARLGTSVALSPDGSRLFYTLGDPAGTSSIWTRPLDQLQGLELIPGGAFYHPFLSPDGEWLGFTNLRELLRVPTTGGTPQRIAGVNLARGAVWAPDGTIIFTPDQTSPLVRVSDLGGEVEPLTTLDEERGESSHRWPALTQDGRAVIFTAQASGNADGADALVALDLDTGERTDLGVSGFSAQTLPTGHIVWAREGTLFAARFDQERLEIVGAPVPVVQQLTTDPGEGGAQYSIAEDGTLAYLMGGASSSINDLGWIDPDGTVTVMELGINVGGIQLSPQDDRIAFTQTYEANTDIWVYDIARGIPSRLSLAPEVDVAPKWGPEGRYVYFTSRRDPEGVYRVLADGSGAAELIYEGRLQTLDVSGDGEWILLHDQGDIRAIRTDGQGDPVDFAVSPAGEGQAAFSPDGRWVAYASNESGLYQVYVRPFPDGPGRWQLSDPADGVAGQPRWSPDGRTVVYRSTGNLRATEVEPLEDTLVPGDTYVYLPAILSRGFAGGWAGLPQRGYYTRSLDVANQSFRVVAVRTAGELETGIDHAVLVYNWFDELNRLVPIER